MMDKLLLIKINLLEKKCLKCPNEGKAYDKFEDIPLPRGSERYITHMFSVANFEPGDSDYKKNVHLHIGTWDFTKPPGNLARLKKLSIPCECGAPVEYKLNYAECGVDCYVAYDKKLNKAVVHHKKYYYAYMG